MTRPGIKPATALRKKRKVSAEKKNDLERKKTKVLPFPPGHFIRASPVEVYIKPGAATSSEPETVAPSTPAFTIPGADDIGLN